LKTELGALCCRPHLSAPRRTRVAPNPAFSTVVRQRAAAGSLPRRRHAAVLLHVALAPPLSRSTSMRRPPLRAPSPPLPVKTEPPPADRIFFSHPTRRSSRPSTPERRTFVPIAQVSSSPVFRHRSPSSTPDSVRASPPSASSGQRPSKLLHLSIDRRLLTPRSPTRGRTQPPSSTTTGATPPPLNTAARRCLRCLTIGTPFRCAPTLSSGSRRSFSPLGQAARLRPHGCFGRPHMAGCRAEHCSLGAVFAPVLCPAI
jgi:hypothetical protein